MFDFLGIFNYMSIRKKIRSIIKGIFSSGLKISPTRKEDIDECLEVCAIVFSKVMAYESVKSYISGTADWGISAKAEYQGRIVGCYILRKAPVGKGCSKEDLSRYAKLNGVEGIGLAVLPEYRDLGIGKKLRAYPLDKGYDYIWGLHLKGLHNIDNWIKFGRRVVCDSGDMFTTLMDLSPKAKAMTAEMSRKQNDKDLKEHDFERFHSYQEAGHTCGPTCLKMVADYLGVDYSHIDELIDLCGCNTKTGTIDTGMKNALNSLGVKNQQNLFHKDSVSAMDFLDSLIDDGDIFIMRTLTKGIKHWIIVYGKAGDHYLVADPWLGKIKYTSSQVLDIWAPRDFDGFLVKR